MNDPEIQQLKDRLSGGDTSALDDAFSTYRNHLLRFVAFRMDHRLTSRLDASDVVQEVYLAALQRLVHFPKVHSLSPLGWLRHVTGQTLIDLERRHLGAECRKISRETSPADFDYANSTCASLALLIAGNATSPSQVALRNERAEQIQQMLSQMNETDREVIALRHFEELSNDEVAEVLEITKAGASNRYVRAMARLAGLMKEIDRTAERS